MIMWFTYKNKIFDIGINKDLVSFSQAIESDESDKWIDAMKDELKSMKDNKVWDLVELSESSRRSVVSGFLKLNVTQMAILNDIS